ncbi:MAG: carboxypeptidase regulatory-like domain-containing protein [Bacteroidaceae bacterium]|nr:carboxypeptidase regulatory-like domain-containing protein [Bacteroidaceae bacterium]
MKKLFVSLLLSVVTIVPTFAQDKPKAGDVIYGRIVDINGPVAGVNVTERDACDRIMAQTKTDLNGEFVFRTVNPENMIIVTNKGYETLVIPIDRQCNDLTMKLQRPLPPVMVLDGPMSLVPELDDTEQKITDEDLMALFGDTYWASSTAVYYDMLRYPVEGMMRADRTYQRAQLPGNGIYIPFTDFATYYTIDELFDNWYPRF